MHRRIVKVFLASPGDLKAEREAAHRVVNEVNRNSADFWNIQIDLIGWEDTVSKFGRAQEVINQELDQCEYFIGIMWQKWGSAPGGAGHPYTSGFEEEFKRSVERRENSGSPEISLLFKAPEESRVDDPGPELTKVLKFRKDIIESKKILFQDFREMPEFEARVRAFIVDYVQKLIISERENVAAAESTAQIPLVENETTQEKSKNELLATDASDFIESILSRSNPDSSVLAADVARFRLIAKTIKRGGNDDETIGAHDANLIYRNRQRFAFTEPEIEGLASAGLKSLSFENVPLWRWLYLSDEKIEDKLLWQYFQNNYAIKTNVIKVLMKCGLTLEGEYFGLTRREIIEGWLKSTSDEVKFTAMDYLAEFGAMGEVELLRPALEEAGSAQGDRALSAAVLIAARNDPHEAVTLINKYPASTVRVPTLNILFKNPMEIRSEMLIECLSHRSSEVREQAVKILCDRNALTDDQARVLLADASPQVRNTAFRFLVKNGSKFSLDEAKKILVKVNRQGRGLAGFLVPSTYDSGGRFYDEYKLDFLKNLDEKQLRIRIEESYFDDFDAMYALYHKYFSSTFNEIEANIQDGFSREFAERIEKIDHVIRNDKGETLKRVEDQALLLKKDVIERVFGIICQLGKEKAIGIVRSVLDKYQPNIAPDAISFLEKFGDWEDVKRLAEMGKPVNRFATLGTTTNEYDDLKAKAILKLGKGRLADILAGKFEPNLLARIIFNVPNSQFSALTDAAVMKLMRHENDKVRRAAALKIAINASKDRSRKLLDSYLGSQDARYYNVIHWLDFGACVPMALKKRLVSKELSG